MFISLLMRALLLRFSSLSLPLTICLSLLLLRLYWITLRAGERQGSGLMKANAWHHRADAISSVVALIGVGKTLWLFLKITLSTSISYS